MKIAKTQGNRSTILFRAKLVLSGGTAKITLPKSAVAKFPVQSVTMVEGTINGFPFRSSLEPNGKGSFWLRVNKGMPNAGDTVMVEIMRVGEESETRVPMDLRKALVAAPLARKVWADITPIARRDWIHWICTAKLPETRRRRIENACDMLASGKRRVCCFPGINWLMKNHFSSRRAN